MTKTVRVLDPRPQIISASLGSSTVEAGQTVTMLGAATGRPPLSYLWTVRRGVTTVATRTGASSSLDTTGFALGSYTVTLSVSNAEGSASSAPLPLDVVQQSVNGFYTVTPCRLLDTRGGLPLVAGGQLQFAVAGNCGIPSNARAVAINVTVVDPSLDGSVTLFPGDASRPDTTTVSFGVAQTRASFAVLGLSRDGSGTLAAYARMWVGYVHLVVDVAGYFAPVP